MLHTIFKFEYVEETYWQRLRGTTQLAEVVEGFPFIDAFKIKRTEECQSPTTLLYDNECPVKHRTRLCVDFFIYLRLFIRGEIRTQE